MVYAFDTLGYAKRLRERGIAQDQAEAHAEAARDFIMAELVTKTDLHAAIANLEANVSKTVALLDAKLEAKIETLSLKLTVRLGAMLAAGIAILAAIQKLS